MNPEVFKFIDQLPESVQTVAQLLVLYAMYQSSSRLVKKVRYRNGKGNPTSTKSTIETMVVPVLANLEKLLDKIHKDTKDARDAIEIHSRESHDYMIRLEEREKMR